MKKKHLNFINFSDYQNNRAEPTCYRTNFHTPVPANKMEVFWYIALRIMLLAYIRAMMRFSNCDGLSRMGGLLFFLAKFKNIFRCLANVSIYRCISVTSHFENARLAEHFISFSQRVWYKIHERNIWRTCLSYFFQDKFYTRNTHFGRCRSYKSPAAKQNQTPISCFHLNNSLVF